MHLDFCTLYSLLRTDSMCAFLRDGCFVHCTVGMAARRPVAACGETCGWRAMVRATRRGVRRCVRRCVRRTLRLLQRACGGTVPCRTKHCRARVRSTQGSTKYKGASRPGLLCRAGAPDFCTNVYLLHHSTSFLTLPKLPRKRCCRLPRRRQPPLVLNGCAKRTRRSSDMVHLNQEIINLFIKWLNSGLLVSFWCTVVHDYILEWYDGAREIIKTSYAIDLYLLLGMNIQEGGVYQIFSWMCKQCTLHMQLDQLIRRRKRRSQ